MNKEILEDLLNSSHLLLYLAENRAIDQKDEKMLELIKAVKRNNRTIRGMILNAED